MTAGRARLVVLQLSDSFSSLWPALARESDLGLELTGSTRDFAACTESTDCVPIVAAGGEEHTLEELFRDRLPQGAEVAAVGSQGERRSVVAVIRAGAADYFTLTDDLDLLRSWVRDRAERVNARHQRAAFSDSQRSKYRFDGILGESPALVAALDRAAKIIPHGNVTVLITGETGTGKELIARALHYNGARRDAPFVDVNCAAIPEQLLESELFGHEKGAFTDASSAKPGLFEVAKGGTLFLDEIAQLPPLLQGKLLRVLQERQIRRVGGTKSIPIDVKVVAATHVHLGDAVKRGEFRQDLYYRLNVVPIVLPPLAARPEDILPLARHFLATFAAEYGVRVPYLLPAAQRELGRRPWPGNVRELRNTIERAVLLSEGRFIDAADVQSDTGTEAVVMNGIPFPAPLGIVIEAAGREMLSLCGGNKSEAARRLEISRTRLQRLLDGNVGLDEAGSDDEQAVDSARDAVAPATPMRRAAGRATAGARESR